MKFFAALTLIFLSSFSSSQTNEFAQIGTKWWYEYSYFSLNGYKTLEAIGDTLIEGKICRIIAPTIFAKDLSNPEAVLDTLYLSNLYIYSDARVVYNYTLGSFYTLYDFNALVGESWLVGGVSSDEMCDSTGEVRVDSFSNISINGFDLKQIYTSSNPSYYWNFGTRPVRERMGSMNYLFPTPEDCLLDFYDGGPLRCYYDPEFGYYTVDSLISCDFLLELTEAPINTDVQIWPNPFSNNINISISTIHPNILITIYDAHGELILQQYLKALQSSINGNSLPKGLYVVKLSSDFIHKTFKLIKL